MTADLGSLVPGRVEYGDRAFEQDTHDAMRGDIVRGLIELITNADDAYARLGDVNGKIRVEIERRKGDWRVVVRDRATGMAQADMTSKITKLADRVSGFESGRAVRGNLGRGAKDVSAFGPTTYESIKDGHYAYLELLPTGRYQALKKSRLATAEDRQRLGIPRGNGTVVTVQVGARVRCPQHNTLVDRLSKHYQLRDIMADPKREVWLANVNTGDAERIRYSTPASLPLREMDLAIAGYSGVTARLEIRRLPERCDQPASDPCRPAGILLKGQRAVYDNTLFSFEQNPYAAFLHGRLECPYIDQLAREYDDIRSRRETPPPVNNMPIITRSRDGLHPEHQFVVALSSAVNEVLADVVREEEHRIRREASRIENESTRRSLDRLAREVARFMEDELRNADAEELPGFGGASGDEAAPLVVIPGEAVCYLDEPKTLTVVARRDGLSAAPEVRVAFEPPGVVAIANGASTTLRPHRRREDLLVGQIRIQPIIPDVTLLQCDVEGREAEALIEVRRERVPAPIPDPPLALEFERPRYRVGWTKKKVLVLRAPSSMFSPGTLVKVTSDHPGIVVLTGHMPLQLDERDGCLRAEIRVDGRVLGSEAVITAEVGVERASCHVLVAPQGEGPLVRFELVDEDQGIYRALWKDHTDPATGEKLRVLQIMGRHPALRRYLGDAPAFPGQETVWVKALIAEIVADNVCREIARRVDAQRTQDERPDADAFYIEHYTRMTKLLPKLHLLMVGAPPVLADAP
jgi:hypothetical protein